ncbi:MAG: serine/threonine-protein kinase [Myxococcota bacterium]|nr:serine/threonine-protein kinase [Myxococcota bacterium]
MSEDVPVPDQIGPYRIIRLAGKGGYARVYLGEDKDGRPYAVKLHFRNRKKALKRFYREFTILSEQRYRSVPRAYQFGEKDGAPWMSMSWIPGETAITDVRAFGQAGSTTRIYRARRILIGVADALDYLHRQNILHCDIKPSNVLVQPNGSITLVDFGAARWMNQAAGVAEGIRFVGTRSYASLELLTAKPTDPRSDLFSVGVMAYKLLTGRRPYKRGDAHTSVDVLLDATPTPPAEWCPEISRELSELVLELMSLQAEKRPQSAAAVSQRLKQIP